MKIIAKLQVDFLFIPGSCINLNLKIQKTFFRASQCWPFISFMYTVHARYVEYNVPLSIRFMSQF